MERGIIFLGGGLSRNRRNFRPPMQTTLIALIAEGMCPVYFIEIMLDMSENAEIENAEIDPHLVHFIALPDVEIRYTWHDRNFGCCGVQPQIE